MVVRREVREFCRQLRDEGIKPEVYASFYYVFNGTLNELDIIQISKTIKKLGYKYLAVDSNTILVSSKSNR